MLGHMPAAASVTDCTEQIHRLIQPGVTPAPEAFEQIAHQLSTLGFFVDALPSGESDFDAFVARLQGKTSEAAEDEESIAAPEATASVESELARQTRDTQALVEALKRHRRTSACRKNSSRISRPSSRMPIWWPTTPWAKAPRRRWRP
jgi:chemosensory pili system protein ChpA (sensor histidine kinase/response regulator)